MNPLRSSRIVAYLMATLQVVTLSLAQKPTAPPSEIGLRFVAGPPDGVALAMAAAKKLPNAGSSDTLRAESPLPLYTLQSDAIAAGKGLETTQACGFQYFIASDARYVGTAEVHVDADCTSQMTSLNAGRFGYETWEALRKLAADEQVKAKSYEARLIYAALQPGTIPTSRMPGLVAIWLKSSGKRDDLIYPLMPGSANIGSSQLYPADEFLKRLRPALTNVQWPTDFAMHTYFADRFLESRGNGVNRMYDEPMQLQDSMRLRITSAMPSRNLQFSAVDAYKLDRVELIGVAMHDKPVAFSSVNHRSLSTLLQGRPLTAFEERALVELTAGETASVHTENAERFVVGALRAQQDCLQCHKAYKTGDLLGALSYRLTPAAPLNSVVASRIREKPEKLFDGAQDWFNINAMNLQDSRNLIDFHYWARDRMLDAVEPLSQEQFTQELGGSFGSVRNTVVHTFSAEWIWLMRWKGEIPTRMLTTDRYPDLAAIRIVWIDHEGMLRGFFESLDERGIQKVMPYRTLAGLESAAPLWQMLQHVVNHASYHRGQVTTLLRQLGAAPPKATDLITFYRENPAGA